jgi:hypothetical protein
MGLVDCGLACVISPQDEWARRTLRHIVHTGLDREGMTFTFDLPFMLWEEAKRRDWPETKQGELPSYCPKALEHRDRWGTRPRALNAHAAAQFRQGEEKEALDLLREAAKERPGFAGYATAHMLALANRSWEIGHHGLVSELIDKAQENAIRIRDVHLRHERLHLVQRHRTWWKGIEVDVATGLAKLAREPDIDARLAYIDFLSAQWISPPGGPMLDGLKKLVPLALGDRTVLDAVLARLCGLYLANGEHQLSDDDLVKAIQICTRREMLSKPWQSGPQAKDR